MIKTSNPISENNPGCLVGTPARSSPRATRPPAQLASGETLVRRLSAWLYNIPRRIGDRVFAMNDDEARWHGWEIIPRHAGLTRRYRDPMFNTLIQCPVCLGRGSDTRNGMTRAPCHACTGTGRLRLQGPGVSYGGELAMASGRPRDPNDPSVWASVETALSDGPRTGIVGVLWYWRYELMVILGLPAGALAIGLTLGTGWLIAAAVLSAGTVAGLVLWPAGRNFLKKRAWCVITAHRVRAGCMNAWIQSRNGSVDGWDRPAIEEAADRLEDDLSGVTALPGRDNPRVGMVVASDK